MAGAVAIGLAACASDEASRGDPGVRPLASGQSCDSLKTELNRLQGRGVGAKADAAGAGRKLSEKDRVEVARYNGLLDQYLGARCHT